MKLYIITLFLILSTLSNSYPQDFWEEAGLDTVTIWSLAINSSGDIFAGTHLDGVFRSTDNGNSWTNLGIMNYDITSMVISLSGDILVNTDPWGGVFRSSDNGNNWIDTLDFKHFNRSIAINNSNGYIFVGTAALGISRTTDNGSTWEEINNGMTASQVNSLVINTSGDIFAGTLQGGVFISTDNGDSWVQINQGLTYNYVTSLALNSSENIFAGTLGHGVFRSTNNGDSWVQINQGLSSEGFYILSLAINSIGDIFVGSFDGVFRSTDNGNNWIQVNQGLTNLYAKSIAIAPNGYGFTGTEGGIFRSLSALPVELTSFKARINQNIIDLKWQTKTEVNNYGFNVERKINEYDWNSIGFVEGNGNSNSPKEYSFIDNNPFGGSKFQYRLKQIDTDGQFEYSDIVEVEVIPNQFELSQNYPNPFNPTTTIRFSLPQATQIKINIYNMLGEQIATIADGMYESGNHKVAFNASNLPSGTYIYRLESSEFVQVKKMILLK